ncbi:MAG: glycoside hydrolase family 2 protein [Roseburia sp.]
MRKIIPINDNWRFSLGSHSSASPVGETVMLPHTWNAVDGHDGNGSYLRTTACYARHIDPPRQPLPGGRTYLDIPAAGQQASVYLNGKKLASHEGGYSTFRVDLTDSLHEAGDNLLVIECSNEERTNVYPQAADFTFYGGLYRGATLILVPDTHFDLDYYGAPGIKVFSTPTEDGGALFTLETFVTNPGEDFTVLYSIREAVDYSAFIMDGGMPDSCNCNLSVSTSPHKNVSLREVASGTRPSTDTKISLYVPQVRLWDTTHPHLYTVTAVLQRRNEAWDEVSTRHGVRTFSCDPDKGFLLNGVPTPLRGVSRHQDMLYQGNALTRADHYADARIIKELGANTIRLAHYQHAQEFYDACDELGFVVWAEIPFITAMSDNPAAHQNCISQLKELIYQNYNHSSICFWGISNEILIGGISEQLVKNHVELNALAKELDPTRLTTIAHVSMTPTDGPMHGITDVESYNHYFGWYGGKYTENEAWLDKYHAEHPDICLGLSEYGCEGILTYHGPNPACKDYSEQYQAEYHEHMAKILMERPWLWSTHVWNMFDFGCAARDEGGVAGRNNKGLVTLDRKTRKDSFYIYQAYWTEQPMVHITGRRYAKRAGETTRIKVYSNQPFVSLYVNHKLADILAPCNHVAAFTVSLEDGFNTITAIAGNIECASRVRDSVTLEKVDREPSIYTLPEVNERAEGVANWFKLAGNLDLTAPMEFPEDSYSIKDTIATIAENEEAFSLLQEAVHLSTGMKIKKDEGMYNMMKNSTMETLFAMAGSSMPEGFLESVNAQLIKIKKS